MHSKAREGEVAEADKPLGDPGEHPLSVLIFSWMRRPGFMRLFLAVLAAVCALLIALEFVSDRHPKTVVESIPGFYGFFGLIAFGVVILSAWPLARVLRRREGYYEIDRQEGGDDR